MPKRGRFSQGCIWYQNQGLLTLQRAPLSCSAPFIILSSCLEAMRLTLGNGRGMLGRQKSLTKAQAFTSAKICPPSAPTLKRKGRPLFDVYLFLSLRLKLKERVAFPYSDLPFVLRAHWGWKFSFFLPRLIFERRSWWMGGTPKETPNHLTQCKFLRNRVVQVSLFLHVLCLRNFTFHSLFHHLLQ